MPTHQWTTPPPPGGPIEPSTPEPPASADWAKDFWRRQGMSPTAAPSRPVTARPAAAGHSPAAKIAALIAGFVIGLFGLSQFAHGDSHTPVLMPANNAAIAKWCQYQGGVLSAYVEDTNGPAPIYQVTCGDGENGLVPGQDTDW